MKHAAALAILLLGGCAGLGPQGNTPGMVSGDCEQVANDDPQVKIWYTNSISVVHPTEARKIYERYYNQAYQRCLRQRGLLPAGGVQPPYP